MTHPREGNLATLEITMNSALASGSILLAVAVSAGTITEVNYSTTGKCLVTVAGEKDNRVVDGLTEEECATLDHIIKGQNISILTPSA